jgi:hypothetical protein
MFINTLKSFVVALFLFATLFGVAGGTLLATELGIQGTLAAVVAGACSFCIAMLLGNRWYLTSDEIMAGLLQLCTVTSTITLLFVIKGIGVPEANYVAATTVLSCFTATMWLAAGFVTMATARVRA